jgi:hypothetical protein
MTDSLRAKQNMEILDVWKDLNSQIVGRQNKQIQAYPESLLPKTQRDVGAEVNTDKSIENINRVLEVKLGALEFLVSQFVSGNSVSIVSSLTKKDPQAKQAEEQVTNTGDVVPLWNSVVRLYQQQGLSRESQNIIKVKVQELTPNLEAMVYGMNQAVDYAFRERNMNAGLALIVLEFLRTLSVYTVIKQQVDSGLLELLSVEQLQRAYKNLLEEQSAERQAILKRFSARGNIIDTPIRNIPDFDVLGRHRRLGEIANELGINPSVLRKENLDKMTGEEFRKFIDEMREGSRGLRQSFDRESVSVLQEIEGLLGQIQALQFLNRKSAKRITEHQETIRKLETEEPIDEEAVRRDILEVPEEPVMPDEPSRVDFPAEEEGGEEYERAMGEYNDRVAEVMRAIDEREAILAHNQELLDLIKTGAERRASVLTAQRNIVSARRNIDLRERHIAEREAKIEPLRATVRAMARNKQSRGTDFLSRAIAEVIRSYAGFKPMKAENTVLAREELQRRKMRRETAMNVPRGPALPAPLPRPGIAPAVAPRVVVDDEKGAEVGDGRGRRAETRGLATLRKNYGFESMSDTDDSDSESDSDEDRPFDFDDAGNDMYYSKPMRK